MENKNENKQLIVVCLEEGGYFASMRGTEFDGFNVATSVDLNNAFKFETDEQAIYVSWFLSKFLRYRSRAATVRRTVLFELHNI